MAGYDIYVANDSTVGFFSEYNNLVATGTGKTVTGLKILQTFWTGKRIFTSSI